MDILEIQEKFEDLLLANPDFDESLLGKDEEGCYSDSDIQHMYSMFEAGTEVREQWQSTKAQAVPEGFVLVKTSDRDQEVLELIDQRDYMESQAEELKDKLQALYGVDFGEHSSCNFPFQNAIDYDDSDLVLVLKEPTYEMLEAGSEARSRTEGHIASIWEAMIEPQEPTNDLN